MKIKKYILLILAVLLLAVACDNKESNKNGKNTKISEVKHDLTAEEVEKYNEYLKLKEEPSSEEWSMFFTEIKKEEFLDKNGNIKNISNEILSIANLGKSIDLIGDYIKQINDVIQKAPKMEAIDKNAENLADSLAEEQKVLIEINDYFGKGDYKTDKLARVQELNDKYKVVLQNRQDNRKIFSDSLNELGDLINRKIEERLEKEGKTVKLNILKFISSVDDYGKIAFGKNDLKYDENEVKELSETNVKVQEAYKKVAEITLENAKKENISESDFNKIKENAKILTENINKMVEAVKRQNIQVKITSASTIIGAKTDLENLYNALTIQK